MLTPVFRDQGIKVYDKFNVYLIIVRETEVNFLLHLSHLSIISS
jgi:hypothetical protein